MSEAALIDGYITLYRADTQAHCEYHWSRVLADLRARDPRLAAKVDMAIKNKSK